MYIMLRQTKSTQLLHRIISACLLGVFLASCRPLAPSPIAGTVNPTNELTSAQSPALTEQAQRTPPALPRLFQSASLNVFDTPHTYIRDSCQYIKAKWDPNNAAPGTIVMIVMFHGIFKGKPETPDGVNVIDFNRIIQHLKDQGFEAINTKQLADFLETNAMIPARSVVIVQDDRQSGENFDKNFRQYWEDWGWPVVNGWTSQPDTLETAWQENIALENEGWVDHQSQGVMVGSYLSDETPKAVVTRELQGSITAFEERYNKTPIAIVWPGGGFGMRPVEMARDLGYRRGFTMNSRGPVMFNWIPLANKEDPGRPAYRPEGEINDPLLTLPRYWPHQVIDALDIVRITGKEAEAYAQEHKAIEMDYYDIVCAPAYGPIPAGVP